MAVSEFLAEAKARGFVFQCTDEEALDAACAAGPIAGYAGFDLTAESLHVGHMIPIMLLRLFQKHGHRPVALMGGGTTRIGDPSFREEARQLLSGEQIAKNLIGIRANIEAFITFGDGPNDAVLVNNADWLDRLSYIEMLREVGVHFSINRMLSFDSVRSRLEREQGLTFLEFNYSILQSYDFRELSRQYGVVLQMGGSDQWGNIVTGLDLGRRMGTPQLYALTSPLLTTASGAKMGKTAAGAVWLNADMLPVYDYWQYWRNAEDADVERFLKLFTTLPLDEVARLAALQGAEINEAKKILANEATALLHGRTAAEAAAETARKTFEEGVLAESLPTVTIAQGEIASGLGVLTAFVKAGLTPSTGEARRQIKGGGLKLNDATIADERYVLSDADFAKDGVAKLSVGKKKHVLLKPE